MTNLKACYDRQLSEIQSIVKESIGIERKLMQLIAKVLPIMEHHICTSFRASIEYCRETDNKQARIEQDHITLVNICRDISCLIMKPIEDQKIGVIIEGPILKVTEYETAVAFVNDMDFASEGEDSQ